MVFFIYLSRIGIREFTSFDNLRSNIIRFEEAFFIGFVEVEGLDKSLNGFFGDFGLSAKEGFSMLALRITVGMVVLRYVDYDIKYPLSGIKWL